MNRQLAVTYLLMTLMGLINMIRGLIMGDLVLFLLFAVLAVLGILGLKRGFNNK